MNSKSNGIAIVPVEKFDKLVEVRKMASKAICKILSADKSLATGALYQVVDAESRVRFLLMICNHVLPTNAIYEIQQTQFLFPDIPQMASFTLDKDHVKDVWTAQLLDATVIEISSELAALFTSYGARFLQVKEARRKSTR